MHAGMHRASSDAFFSPGFASPLSASFGFGAGFGGSQTLSEGMTSSSRSSQNINGRTVSTESTTQVRAGRKTTITKTTRDGRTSVTEEVADASSGRVLSLTVDGQPQVAGAIEGQGGRDTGAARGSVEVQHVRSGAGRRVTDGPQW